MPELADALALGLTREEYELVCEKQGGAPNALELAMYSLLWSEHCAYKHSKKLLRTLPTSGPHVVVGPGENAGAVDVGGGLDYKLPFRNFSWRVQGDYVHTRYLSAEQNDVRGSTGIVWRF